MFDLVNLKLHMQRYSVRALAIVGVIESVHAALLYVDPNFMAKLPAPLVPVVAALFAVAGFFGAFIRQQGMSLVPSDVPPAEGGSDVGPV
jgi:hypothetical protein